MAPWVLRPCSSGPCLQSSYEEAPFHAFRFVGEEQEAILDVAREMTPCDASKTGADGQRACPRTRPPTGGAASSHAQSCFQSPEGVLCRAATCVLAGPALWHFVGFSLCVVRTLTKLKPGHTGESLACVIMRVWAPPPGLIK